MNITTLSLVLICVLLNVGAQLALKQGVETMGAVVLNLPNFFPTIMKMITSYWIIIGGVIYVASVFVWLLVLNRIEVSKAYPLISIGYLLNAVAAYYLLGEHVTLMRVVGILIILNHIININYAHINT